LKNQGTKFFSKRFFMTVAFGVLSLFLLAPQKASAYKVLIISTGSFFIDTDLVNELTCAGATVTLLNVAGGSTAVFTALSGAGLPTTGAGLAAAFDEIWDARWPSTGNTTISGPYTTANSDENIYYNYLASAGSLYMMFEVQQRGGLPRQRGQHLPGLPDPIGRRRSLGP
jgi:hypothetical protein